VSVKISPDDYVIHVNRGSIDSNRKQRNIDPDSEIKPVLKLQKGKTGRGSYGYEVEVLGQDGKIAAVFHYDPEGILACGAKVVLVAPYGARIAK